MKIRTLLARRPRLTPSARLYLFSLLTWLSLVAVLAGIIFNHDLRKAEQEFSHDTALLFEHLTNTVHINESTLEAFASLVGSTAELDAPRLRAYARRMLERYPQIYMFEVTQAVTHPEIKGFVSTMREQVHEEFRVTAFGFDGSREWHDPPEREIYYPIVFIEPMTEASLPVLGLDLASSPIFMQALRYSEMFDKPVVTPSFTLLEGWEGFLLSRAVTFAAQAESGDKHYHAILVIRTEALLPRHLFKQTDLHIEIYQQGLSEESGHASLLYQEAQRHTGWLSERLFPRLVYSRNINSLGQPISLYVDHQLGWHDLNLWLYGALLVAAFVSFWMAIVLARAHHYNEMRRLQYENRLYNLANNDSLTGLANRNYLVDRLRHALARASRRGTRLALLFLDMDNFKWVNDNFGHANGDQLLKRVAERFKSCMREEDTVCRYQGDEFVILLEDIHDADEVAQIADKIHQCLEKPFMIHGRMLHTSVSIGTALYPDDADCVEGLLHVADLKMYRKKKRDTAPK